MAATIRIERFDPEEEESVVTANLSAFGGPDDMSLVRLGEGVYELEHILTTDRPNGQWAVIVWIRQQK